MRIVAAQSRPSCRHLEGPCGLILQPHHCVAAIRLAQASTCGECLQNPAHPRELAWSSSNRSCRLLKKAACDVPCEMLPRCRPSLVKMTRRPDAYPLLERTVHKAGAALFCVGQGGGTAEHSPGFLVSSNVRTSFGDCIGSHLAMSEIPHRDHTTRSRGERHGGRKTTLASSGAQVSAASSFLPTAVLCCRSQKRCIWSTHGEMHTAGFVQAIGGPTVSSELISTSRGRTGG